MTAAKHIEMYPSNDTVKRNLDTGYVCLYRSIKNHWLWKENRIKTPLEAWLDLILRASHNDQKEPIGVDFIIVKKGQVLTSQLQLSKDWFWSRKKVTHFLHSLTKDSMISVNTSRKWSMITICKYDSYQGRRTTKEQLRNNRSTTEEHIQSLETLKEDSTGPIPKQKFSHDGYFDRQIKNNQEHPELGKYQKLVEFLHERDEEGKARFENILSLDKQISFKDYLNLKESERGSGRTLKEVLEAMENRKDLKKEYNNVYLTANNWLKREFKK